MTSPQAEWPDIEAVPKHPNDLCHGLIWSYVERLSGSPKGPAVKIGQLSLTRFKKLGINEMPVNFAYKSL